MQITNLKQKQYIVATYFCNTDIGQEKVFRLWKKFWENDFTNPDARIIKMYNHEIHNWQNRKNHSINEELNTSYYEVYGEIQKILKKYNKDRDKIKVVLKRIQNETCSGGFPINLRKQAEALGYVVSYRKYNRNHPLLICGYKLVKSGLNTYGKYFDLTISDVKRILKADEEAVNE